ncbi:LD-carboxypeptidase [Uliginosibacterium sp. H3]|uniref:LD-carboxypeptidase n=1 Tax=Uliginosibacterium silvisoli TaxID=3114758 RepID=A0ABU6K531_9RHOO|nr:LD-carboxypeptidase [Uliginosibacterium sp. H3]
MKTRASQVPPVQAAAAVKPVIAIVAPSAFLPEIESLDRAVAAMQAQGWELRYDRAALIGRSERFPAPDAERIAALYAAAEDPEVNVVMALRGGYGMSRLLDDLDFSRIAAGNKLWVGHSDFTAFQLALLQHTGHASLAGPMAATDFGGEHLSAFTLAHFRRWFEEAYDSVAVPVAPGWTGEVSGLLWGGNLTMLAHLVGGPHCPQISDGVLFIEDAGETPFRLERLLYQLWHARILQAQRAIVFGQFGDYRLTERDNGYDLGDVIAHWQDKLGVPVFSGLMHGHVTDKLSLPVGGYARLRADASGYAMEYGFRQDALP